MMNAKCKEVCLCATCVLNDNYCTNTPRPCVGCLCEVCESCDMKVDFFCNHHLTIEEVNARIEEDKKERRQ